MYTALIIGFLVYHYLADYILQDLDTRQSKSSQLDTLIRHVSIYSFSYIPLILILTVGVGFTHWMWLFIPITLVTHYIIDSITSRVSTRYLQEDRMWEAVNVMGLDQLLHNIRIILTVYLILLWG